LRERDDHRKKDFQDHGLSRLSIGYPPAMTSRLLLTGLVSLLLLPAQTGRAPLGPAEIEDIAHLLQLEDTRKFDEPALTRMLSSTHLEVRRRVVMTIGRIAKEEGRPLLAKMRSDKDTHIVATVAFASGQLKDPGSVTWLGERLMAANASPIIAREAAIALGKIRTPDARQALSRFLTDAPTDTSDTTVVGEALLSIGRFTTREDFAPILRWVTASGDNVRWRAAWALFRPRNPDALPHLLTMSRDPSADVRAWAVRGLARIPGQDGAEPISIPGAAARLRDAVNDPDRRVRTEALRALATYPDDESFAVVLAALDSTDTWISVSAAESMARYTTRADAIRPKLISATGAGKPLALRVTALPVLVTIAPEAALEVAAALAREKSAVARQAVQRDLGKLGEPGRVRLAELAAADPSFALATGGRGQGGGAPQPPAPARTLEDYKRLVTRWIVPEYMTGTKPRAIWRTPRGEIEIELNAADAPMGAEFFAHVVESGAIVGTEFGRVVPNFVAQQRTIEGAIRLRDEVNRDGLNRGTLSWASSGLDTGRPGYTLGNAPQPHNEGDFTALGRVIRGMEAVDVLALGDAITAARMVATSK
jgi:HEAT repeat protein/cyclophilin family peptidyl-prolyl cis-trans isomerase